MKQWRRNPRVCPVCSHPHSKTMKNPNPKRTRLGRKQRLEGEEGQKPSFENVERKGTITNGGAAGIFIAYHPPPPPFSLRNPLELFLSLCTSFQIFPQLFGIRQKNNTGNLCHLCQQQQQQEQEQQWGNPSANILPSGPPTGPPRNPPPPPPFPSVAAASNPPP